MKLKSKPNSQPQSVLPTTGVTSEVTRNPQGSGQEATVTPLNPVSPSRELIDTPRVSGYWIPGEKMNGKPVLYRTSRTVITLKSDGFLEKLLCGGPVFNNGDACTFGCTFCYVLQSMRRLVQPLIDEYNRRNNTKLKFQDFVIRRDSPLDLIKMQLLDDQGNPRFADADDDRVIYSSTLVDVAGNKDILQETADVCNLILEHTNWQIRLLSKCSLLKDLVAKKLIPKEYHHRLIFGFSTGTLDDGVARAIEKGTSSVSKRIEALHWLQDHGFRTFGMICPNLPQKDYGEFSRDICTAIRVDRCEHVWAEVINVRGESMKATSAALRAAGFVSEADELESVSGAENSEAWENYARETFIAHTANVPPEKLRFLQYLDKNHIDWWKNQRAKGAVLIGSVAIEEQVTAVPSTPKKQKAILTHVHKPTAEEKKEFSKLDKIVRRGVSAFIEFGNALSAIKQGSLWRAGGFATWETYCRQVAGLDRTYANRLIRAASDAAIISTVPIGPQDSGVVPRAESQIRPLSSLKENEDKIRAWVKAVEKSNGEQPTAKEVKEAVLDILQKLPKPSGNASKLAQQREVLERLKAAIQDSFKMGELLEIVAELQDLIEPSKAKKSESTAEKAASAAEQKDVKSKASGEANAESKAPAKQTGRKRRADKPANARMSSKELVHMAMESD
jgi:DNA repair photolyase